MLALLPEGIYGVRRWNGLRWHDVRTKFRYDRLRQLTNITVIFITIYESVKLVLLIEGIIYVRR
jgi:hypothetical protein